MLWSSSLPYFSDACYLTRNQVSPVGTKYSSQGQAMSCRSGDSKGCVALFRQDFEDKFGLLGIGDMEVGNWELPVE